MRRRQFLQSCVAASAVLSTVSANTPQVSERFTHGRVVALGRNTESTNRHLVDRIHWGLEASSLNSVSTRKLHLLVSICEQFSQYYGTKEPLGHWVYRLALREALASTAMNGVGLAHQFQGRHGLPTLTESVHWWAFLIPQGCDFNAIDRKPVHVVLARVFSEEGKTSELQAWTAAQQLSHLILTPKQLANLDTAEATQTLNNLSSTLLDGTA